MTDRLALDNDMALRSASDRAAGLRPQPQAASQSSIPSAEIPPVFWYLRDRCEFPVPWRLYAAWKMLVDPNNMAAAFALHGIARLYAQGTSGSAQDAQRLDPKGAGPVANGDAPQTHSGATDANG